MDIKLRPDMEMFPLSRVHVEDTTYFLVKDLKRDIKLLGVSGNAAGFIGEEDEGSGILYCPLSPANAGLIRSRLDWLNPVPLFQDTTMGFGDRLGLATPGHVQAVRSTGVSPIFAQQSVRENERTGRTPQEVIDDAMWGVFQESWQAPWGADGDHVKEPVSISPFVDAGYTFFTIDPSDYVDNEAHTASAPVLKDKFTSLPWEELETTPGGLQKLYLEKSISLDGYEIGLDEGAFYRAAAKYGRALVKAREIYQHIISLIGNDDFDLEFSVDESDVPTTIMEHFYIACELRRLGINFVSLAPRFVGRFEKGVDFIGDLDEFERNLVNHVRVMRFFGGYKLSIHTGSDKFSIYPLIVKHAEGLVHVKTAGTSYLEALRVVAMGDPRFFREILELARSCYPNDRATYHVSAELGKVPAHEELPDEVLPELLEQFDARQVLHVTFGSILDEFGSRLRQQLVVHEEEYARGLREHFKRHLQSFQK